MAKLYELSLEVQIRKLRNTAIMCFVVGGMLACSLLEHNHKMWALLTSIITFQVVIGSAIMMFDIKRDLLAIKETPSKESQRIHK